MSCCFDKSQNDGHQWSHDRANSGIWCSTLLRAICHFTAAVHRFFMISWALKMHTMEHLRRFSKISQFTWWELSTFKDIFSFGDKSFCLYLSFIFFSVYRCQTLYSTSILELNRDMCRRVWFLGLDWIFTSTAILDHTNHLVAAITIKKELFSKN